jgi:ethanolamine ammonia-lyase small subunit
VPREKDDSLVASDLPAALQKIRARTPARILKGRAGAAYRTAEQLELREAHAAARDAVRTADKQEYLVRPDLGRHFDEEARQRIAQECPAEADVQIVIGDGLSVPAVARQAPGLLPLIYEGVVARGWRVGRVFVVRHCRVGILNEVGELLRPRVVVLLIGERPGLATADSLSAYMAHRPSAQQTDADRNLISNIHGRGIAPGDAAARILNLAARMMQENRSGYTIKESQQAELR